MLEGKVTVNITLALAPEVMGLIKGLVGGLSIPTKEVGQAPVQSPQKIDKPSDTKPKEEVKPPVEEETEQESSITVEELRALTSKAAKKDKAAVKELLSGFDAKSVSTLAKEHYQAYHDKVKELA